WATVLKGFKYEERGPYAGGFTATGRWLVASHYGGDGTMKRQLWFLPALGVPIVIAIFVTIAHAAAMENVELVGLADHRVEKDGDAQIETFAIKVTTATAKNGDRIAEIEGELIVVTGPKSEEIRKNDGQEVLAFGTLSENKTSLEADSVIKIPPKE